MIAWAAVQMAYTRVFCKYYCIVIFISGCNLLIFHRDWSGENTLFLLPEKSLLIYSFSTFLWLPTCQMIQSSLKAIKQTLTTWPNWDSCSLTKEISRQVTKFCLWLSWEGFGFTTGNLCWLIYLLLRQSANSINSLVFSPLFLFGWIVVFSIFWSSK